jgi:outer membrane protein assembly factor BamB
MADTRMGTLAPRTPLRLWPGVVIVVLLLLSRWGVKAAIPGFEGFSLGMIGAILGSVLVLLWWLLLSRAPWSERVGAVALMVLGMGATWRLSHESMGPLWFVGYAVPVLCLAFVASAVISRRFPQGRRRATMAAAILIACAGWLLVRTSGINGDHVAEFGWRWALSSEERLLTAAPAQPLPEPSVAPVVETPSKPVTGVGEEQPVDAPTADAVDGATGPAIVRAAGVAGTPPGWTGFRGSHRDGVARGAHIVQDWTNSPPVPLWRRSIGPGWSSFAVHGDILYTQEQRGDDEVVAAYRVTTGEPIWAHRDAARFFESNGGAGPRGTPTLSNDRVYAFGATGILNALDAATGAVVWSNSPASETSTNVPPWGFSSSPLVVDDVVVVAVGGQLAGYDAATGKRRWLGPSGGGSYSSPHLVVIDGVAQILLIGDRALTSVAPASGEQLWEHEFPGSISIVQPAMVGDGDVLFTRMDAGARRIAVSHQPGGWTTKERWTSNALKPYFNDFVVHEGHAFGFDGRILACIDLQDGTRKWKGGRYGNGQLVLLPEQDLLLVLSEEGELALVAATKDEFKELARFPAIAGKTWNHPVLVGDILLVRNGEEMAAFRLPSR